MEADSEIDDAIACTEVRPALALRRHDTPTTRPPTHPLPHPGPSLTPTPPLMHAPTHAPTYPRMRAHFLTRSHSCRERRSGWHFYRLGRREATRHAQVRQRW